MGADILNDKEIAHFVFGSPENESVLSASLAFPENAVMAFHWSQPKITRRWMTREVLKKSLGPSPIIESEIFRGPLFVVLAILPACHRTITI
jgi:hypothetical protein